MFRLRLDQDQQVKTVATPPSSWQCGVGELGQVQQPLVLVVPGGDGVEAGLLPLGLLLGITTHSGDEEDEEGEDRDGGRHETEILAHNMVTGSVSGPD